MQADDKDLDNSGAPAKSQSKFKLMGHVVMAMKRFQASLNPTYTRGKRMDYGEERDEAHMQAVLQAQGLPATSPNRHSAGDRRTTSGRTISGRDIGPPGAQHGHKGNLLFRPLAPAPAEVQN